MTLQLWYHLARARTPWAYGGWTFSFLCRPILQSFRKFHSQGFLGFNKNGFAHESSVTDRLRFLFTGDLLRSVAEISRIYHHALHFPSFVSDGRDDYDDVLGGQQLMTHKQ